MKRTKNAICVFLVLIMGISLVFTSGCTKTAKEMVVCVGPYPDTIDPALNSAVDGATYIIHAFSGLVGYKQGTGGKLELYPDCAKELPKPTALSDGKVQYVFELKDNLKWSDGSELTAEDFVYAWNRVVLPETGADYSYMFDVIDGYNDVISKKEGAKLNVTASDDGKKLTVVLPVDVPYFMELCAFPTYMPVKKSVVEGNESWATAAETYIGNGPYKVTEFSQGQLVMEKNEYYHNAGAVVTNKIVFAFNDDDSLLLANYKSGAYLLIDSVPNEEINTLKVEYPNEFFVEGQLGTYYICFNINDPILSVFTQEEAAKIRNAMSLLIDRNHIVNEIGKAGQVPAAGYVAMGLTEPDGTEYIKRNGYNHDGSGYYSVAPEDYPKNCAEAIALFKEVAASSGKFTVGQDNKLVGFPELSYIYNTGSGHQAIAEYLQALYSDYGIKLNVSSQEWGTFLNTRKDGKYSIARNGWLADYNDPISFLDMWITNSGNNDCQFGRDAHATYGGYTYNGKSGLTWSQSYDAIISEVKSTGDQVKRFSLMHEAEDILMSTGCICPIYYYTDIFMCSPKIKGFFSNPLGYKYFMYAKVQE